MNETPTTTKKPVNWILRIWRSVIHQPSLLSLLTGAFIVLGILISAFIIFILYNNFKNELRAELRNRLVSITTIAALQQDGDTLLKVSARNDEYYNIINERNLKIRSADPDLIYVYTMRKNEQGIYFIVDANLPGDEGIADFGQAYEEPGPTLQDNFDTLSGTIIEPDFYTDEFGTFLSAYAPIHTSTGERIGVLGIDIAANDVVAKERQFLNRSLIIFLASLPVIALLGYLLGRQLTIPLTELTRTVLKIAEGNLEEQAIEPTSSKEVAQLAIGFNRMTQKLGILVNSLESQVTERTEKLEKRASQLQAITELSEAIAQLQDLNKLFPATTHLVSERFGFYHVGIFLVDSNREFAILQAANSEGGQRMLIRSHRLKLGTGVVGYAAQTGQPRIALDVGADAVFFDNPDLPDTRSEAALPLMSRGEAIGVLDVQSTEPGAFSTEDLQVLTALANQVSIAFENARLLTETRAALMQVQEVYNEFTRAEWSRTVSLAEQPGFRYHAGRIEMLEDELHTPEVVSAVENGQVAAHQVNVSNEKRGAVAVPVKLRGEVIGVLHIESDDSSKEWQDDEIGLVEAVAERAAIAVENARLFQEARRRAAKEQLISEASARIGSAFNLENILQTTAEELERVLGGSEILIQFQSREAE
ncbi:MAG TPA: GAF domain-containing protein [Anaerolineales bacterium]|nr:GAF domain-containing protein [Anaerolineales bacterium]